MKQLINIIVYC